MNVSPTYKNRKVNGNRKNFKQRFLRQIHLEQLERRELMAADVSSFQNPIHPLDVDGDFRVSPLDALVVINALNATGPGSLAGTPVPEDFNWNIDVDGDNALSPLDALSVINRLNSGEGELPPTVGVKYEFYRVNADGSLGTLIPDADTSTPDTPDAVIGTGERIIVRTTMTDLRRQATHQSNPKGVFSAYHDLNFTNADNSAAEKLQLQWGEVNRLTINPSVTGGSFTLKYGDKSTSAIAPVFDNLGILDTLSTRAVVQTRLEAIFGVGNVRVAFAEAPNTSKPDYAISFIGDQARKDITPEGVVELNNLVSAVEPKVTLTTRANPTPTSDDVTRAALNHDINNGTFDNGTGPSPIVRYTNGQAGSLLDVDQTNPAKRTVRRLGGFANQTAEQNPQIATRYLGIVDTLFVGAQAGLVNLNGTITPLPVGGGGGDNLGIAVFGARAVYLTADQVVLPTGTINIMDRLTATNNSYMLAEDEAATTLNVAGDDSERFGNPFGIIRFTQPTGGAGSVTLGTGTNPKNVVFTPSKDFFGSSTFTYTIKSSLGDEATATVSLTITPVNDPPTIIPGGLAYNATEDQTSPLVVTPSQVFSPGPPNEIAPPQSQVVSFASVTPIPASQGTVSLNNGNLEFLPAPDFFGTVNVVVQGSDGQSANSTATATLTITVAGVNDAPVPVGNGNFSTNEEQSLTITPAQLFTAGPANETPPQVVTLSIVTGPTVAQGVASIAGDSLKFDPAKDFFGPVTMVVRGTDNGTNPNNLFTDRTITVTVNNVNDNPIAIDDPAFTVIALGDPNTLDVLANDLPGPSGEPGTLTIVSVTTVTPSTSGTVVVAADGKSLVFTPSTNPSVFGTTATFNYTIKDEGNLTAIAKVTVTILPPASPYAVDDDYRSNESFVILEDETGELFDVLANDYSVVPATKILTLGTNNDQPKVISGPGSVSIGANNRITYTTEDNRNGQVVFTYAMNDGDTVAEPNERRLATATILVREVNDPPVARDDVNVGDGTEDTVKVISGSSITSGLSRGPFEDDQKLTVISAIVRSGGGQVALSNGNITYTPAANYFGPVVIEYTVQDDGTTAGAPDPKSSTANLTFNLAPVNDQPEANPDPIQTVAENTPFAPSSLTIAIADLIANDNAGPDNVGVPPQNQIVSFVPLTGTITTAKGGSVTQVGNNLVYTPVLSFNSADNRGPDTFTYQITDSQSVNQFATGTVTINVTEVNDPPETKTSDEKAVFVEVFAGLPTVIDLRSALSAANWSRGAANEASQTLVLMEQVTNPSVGTVSDFGSTQFTYFAPLGTDATTGFTFIVEDNGSTAGIGADGKQAFGRIVILVRPFQPSSFSGTVFLDDDADGTQDRVGNDPIEAPIGGVEVSLTYIDPITKMSKTVTEMTAADGSYDFELLPPAEYTVSYSTPQHMVNGPGAVMSHTKKISAPGGVNSVFNFPVQGIKSEYVTYLEFLSSSYNQNEPGRRRGMHAAISAQGTTDWVSYYGKPNTAAFYEVVLSNDGTKAYLTEVAANGTRVRTAELGRRDFFRMATDNGGQIVRIIKDPSEITNWVNVDRSKPSITAQGYLDTVDDFFTQENWG